MPASTSAIVKNFERATAAGYGDVVAAAIVDHDGDEHAAWTAFQLRMVLAGVGYDIPGTVGREWARKMGKLAARRTQAEKARDIAHAEAAAMFHAATGEYPTGWTPGPAPRVKRDTPPPLAWSTIVRAADALLPGVPLFGAAHAVKLLAGAGCDLSDMAVREVWEDTPADDSGE